MCKQEIIEANMLELWNYFRAFLFHDMLLDNSKLT
jgi:hypothetical protein